MGLRWYHFAAWGAFILGLMALPRIGEQRDIANYYLCQLPRDFCD